jgi:putative ABC transport system permease protein
MPESRSTGQVSDEYLHGYQVVTPDYFQTIGTPLLGGRFFTQHDQADGQRVAIVNQRLAKQYWPDQDPIGKRLVITTEGSPVRRVTVVGLVADAGCSFWGDPPRAALYVPHRQDPCSNMIIVARTLGDPGNVATAVRRAVHNLSPDVPTHAFCTLDEIVDHWLRGDRILVGFLGSLAACALGLAAIGLYGVMSFTVAQRTREIGLRVALGARRHDVLGMVLKRCLVLASVGIAIGLTFSVPVGMVLAAQLYGVTGVDPLAFVGVISLLLGAALVAGYLPARRAAKVDPMVALRCE